jgi:hypothetical protein
MNKSNMRFVETLIVMMMLVCVLMLDGTIEGVASGVKRDFLNIIMCVVIVIGVRGLSKFNMTRE